MELKEPEASTKCRSRSFVEDVIEFDVVENPPWRSENSTSTVSEMVKDIVAKQEQWISMRKSLDPESLKDVERDFLLRFIYHVNTEEDHGCQGSVEEVEECLGNASTEKTVPEQETININNAYSYLKQEVDKEEESLLKEGDESLRGFLELNLLKKVHRIILEKVPVERGKTPPGQLSRNRRCTEYKGETYEYRQPADMEGAVLTLLDRYNSLVNSLKNEDNKEVKVYKLFKVCSWLIFELLDLHPFGDGNGRLCRLLCSYVLSVMTPFPTSIYNIWSPSSKDDYIQALVDTRKNYSRQPRSLAAMIIECNWYGWNNFLKEN